MQVVQVLWCEVYLGGRQDHAFDPLRFPEHLDLLNDSKVLIRRNRLVEEPGLWMAKK